MAQHQNGDRPWGRRGLTTSTVVVALCSGVAVYAALSTSWPTAEVSASPELPRQLRSTDSTRSEHTTDPASTAHADACGSALFNGQKWCLPDDSLLGFVEIPAGSFAMGSHVSDRGARQDERWVDSSSGQGVVVLPAFYIGRYEVTTAQVQRWVRSVDHRGELPRGALDHPQGRITWNEAIAYTWWLEDRLRAGGPSELRDKLADGWRVTLPSEAEWEKAARGADNRIYPWGDRPHLAVRGNFRDHSRRTWSVDVTRCPGCLHGLANIGGNVWEWTRSLHRPYPYVATDGREDLGKKGPRILRGGSYNVRQAEARVAVRVPADPHTRSGSWGFRVVITPG